MKYFKNSFIIFRFPCLCYTKMLNNLNTFLPVIHDQFIPTSCTHEVEENNLGSHKTWKSGHGQPPVCIPLKSQQMSPSKHQKHKFRQTQWIQSSPSTALAKCIGTLRRLYNFSIRSHFIQSIFSSPPQYAHHKKQMSGAGRQANSQNDQHRY